MYKTQHSSNPNDVFCRLIDSGEISKEEIFSTVNFIVVHDKFPLCEGHLLILPKFHIECYGFMKKKYSREYAKVKEKALKFIEKYYGKAVCFEHCGIAQTVKHAHMHIVPTDQSVLSEIYNFTKLGDKSIKRYLYYEENGRKYIFSPTMRNIKPGIIYGLLATKMGNFDGNVIRAYLNVKERFNEYES